MIGAIAGDSIGSPFEGQRHICLKGKPASRPDCETKREYFERAVRTDGTMPPTYIGTRFVREIPIVRFKDDCPLSSGRSYSESLMQVCASVPSDARGGFPLYRGVGAAALRRILRHGVDVLPTNSPLWASTLEKALEYGRLVLVLDREHVRPSFTWRYATSSAEEIREAEAEFGIDYDEEPDGARYYSRWPKGHPNRQPAYEMEHGYYVPGDARAALMGVLHFAASGEIVGR